MSRMKRIFCIAARLAKCVLHFSKVTCELAAAKDEARNGVTGTFGPR